MILYAKGYLNSYKWPKIPGLDSFKGKVIHSAKWPKEYTEEEWAKDRIAVVGSGASSIQIVPSIQPKAKHIDLYARTGVWFSQISEQFAQNHVYSEDEKKAFHSDANNLIAATKELDSTINRLWTIFFEDNPLHKELEQSVAARMKEHFGGHEELYKGFKPDFPIGCELSIRPFTPTSTLRQYN